MHLPVSIHASARDATLFLIFCVHVKSCFNPRVRAGRDAGRDTQSHFWLVSIHASARDATELGKKLAADDPFQSTRPRGTRRTRLAAGRLGQGFNPRVRAGRDYLPRRPREYFNSFNPRVRAGRDTTQAAGNGRSMSFNPRVRAGRDRELRHYGRIPAVSIHASARDATWFQIQHD